MEKAVNFKIQVATGSASATLSIREREY